MIRCHETWDFAKPDDYQPPCCRDGDETLRALCSSQYVHMSLSVMSKLLLEAVQSATFNAWVGFTGDRIYRRRRKIWILRHPAPLSQQPLKLPAAAAKETSDREVADLSNQVLQVRSTATAGRQVFVPLKRLSWYFAATSTRTFPCLS